MTVDREPTKQELVDRAKAGLRVDMNKHFARLIRGPEADALLEYVADLEAKVAAASA